MEGASDKRGILHSLRDIGISVGPERENDPGQKNSRLRNTSTKGDEALVLLFWSQNEEEEEDARESRADLK